MAEENLILPDRMGVMVLPGAVLFPGTMLPLFIFEPRYREMLAGVLESDRMFALATAREEGGDPMPAGAAGIVRACVANENGTSNLILQGLCRVRFTGWLDDVPYPTATIEPVASTTSASSDAEALRSEILAMIKRADETDLSLPGHLVEMLHHPCPCELFSDLAASCIVESLPVRLRLIEEPDVTRRMEILAAYLSHQLASNP
jgi:Lon protease-like protein